MNSPLSLPSLVRGEIWYGGGGGMVASRVSQHQSEQRYHEVCLLGLNQGILPSVTSVFRHTHTYLKCTVATHYYYYYYTSSAVSTRTAVHSPQPVYTFLQGQQGNLNKHMFYYYILSEYLGLPSSSSLRGRLGLE